MTSTQQEAVRSCGPRRVRAAAIHAGVAVLAVATSPFVQGIGPASDAWSWVVTIAGGASPTAEQAER